MASGAETPAPTMPASETRALALTRVRSSGSSRGTAAARVTPYALDATRHAERRGEQPGRLVVTTDEPAPSTRNARIAIVAPIAHRRPCANRSRNGPISGATIANGSIVRPRNSATCPRASPVGTWKNRVPASEMATAASPAVLNTCISISRERPERPAPSALGGRRACRRVTGWPAPPARPGSRAALPVFGRPCRRPTFAACSRPRAATVPGCGASAARRTCGHPAPPAGPDT